MNKFGLQLRPTLESILREGEEVYIPPPNRNALLIKNSFQYSMYDNIGALELERLRLKQQTEHEKKLLLQRFAKEFNFKMSEVESHLAQKGLTPFQTPAKQTTQIYDMSKGDSDNEDLPPLESIPGTPKSSASSNKRPLFTEGDSNQGLRSWAQQPQQTLVNPLNVSLVATAGPLIANAFMSAAETVGIPAEYQAIASAAIGAAATSGMILYSASQLARQIDPNAPDKEMDISFTAQSGASSSGIRRNLGPDMDAELMAQEQQLEINEFVKEKEGSIRQNEEFIISKLIELDKIKKDISNQALGRHLEDSHKQDVFSGQGHRMFDIEVITEEIETNITKLESLQKLLRKFTKGMNESTGVDWRKYPEKAKSYYENRDMLRKTKQDINETEIKIEELKTKYNIV